MIILCISLVKSFGLKKVNSKISNSNWIRLTNLFGKPSGFIAILSNSSERNLIIWIIPEISINKDDYFADNKDN